jgi:hypothetical protein
MAAMLDRHPDMAVPPETFLFPNRSAFWFSSSTREKLKRLLSLPHIQATGIEADRLFRRAEGKSLDFTGMVQVFLEAYAEQKGKTRVGEKTPSHLDFVPEILSKYPGAKIVMLLRDGRAVVESMRRMPWKYRNLRRFSHTWMAGCRRILEYQDKFGDRVMIVRFRDLIERPRQTVTKVDEFVGLRFHPDQLDHTKQTGVASVQQAHRRRIFEKIDPSRVAQWREAYTPLELSLVNRTMRRYLERFGYGSDPVKISAFRALADGLLDGFWTLVYLPRIRNLVLLPRRLKLWVRTFVAGNRVGDSLVVE